MGWNLWILNLFISSSCLFLSWQFNLNQTLFVNVQWFYEEIRLRNEWERWDKPVENIKSMLIYIIKLIS